jgi:hypothetical protein
MTVTTMPVRVVTGADDEGCLVFCEERLVAVLARLSDDDEIAPGHWFYEAGFGALDGPDHPTFASLEEAKDYIALRMRQARRSPAAHVQQLSG